MFIIMSLYEGITNYTIAFALPTGRGFITRICTYVWYK